MRNFAMRYAHPTGGLASAVSKKQNAHDPRRQQSIYQVHLTDEQAKAIIAQYLDGVPIKLLVDKSGFSESGIKNICYGINRGHLLREVEEEFAKAKRTMG